MRLIFFGTPDFALPSLQTLLDRPEFEVLAVVTQPDRRRGRGKQLAASPVKELAQAAGLPVWQPKRLKKDATILDKLRQSAADAFVVVAYGQLLSPEILALPRLGCINAHGSLLPAYRGAAPIQRSLVAGEPRTGIVTMLMDAGMDTGPMLLRDEVAVGLLDNAEDLGHGLALLAAGLLPDTLLGLDRGEIEPEPQDDRRATYAPPIDKAEYELDWSQPAIALHDKIRGFYPNCATAFRGKSLKIAGTAPLGPAYWDRLPPEFNLLERDWAVLEPQFQQAGGGPGAIAGIVKHVGPVVQTGDGFLLLRRAIPAGKRPQSGWDFANGMHLQIGERLGAE